MNRGVSDIQDRITCVHMLKHYSVKDLYPLALAEGEGMGTAYEYYVKRLALDRFLATLPRLSRILIAGLPQKYGASLDFMLLASEIGAEVTVIDDRPEALERLRHSVDALRNIPGAPTLRPPAMQIIGDLETLAAVNDRFDLILSSEVVQRLSPNGREFHVGHLFRLADAVGLFCPNADNDAHNSRSGLTGLSLSEIGRLVSAQRGGTAHIRTAYIDMPPFPPGITRTAEQREDATSGTFEATMMWGLQRYAHVERFVPVAVRRRHAHIVYALAGG